ncbi:MAG: preprotein translocase subunit SecG [Puniceicoccaceae bacterium]
MSIIIVVFTALLLLLSAFVVLIILMQKPSANAGMGSALGGGAAEQAFGGNAANVLTKTTVFAIIGFFVLSFALYLGNLAMSGPATQRSQDGDNLGALVSSIEEDAPEPEAVVTEPAEQPDAAVDEAEAASLDELLDGTQPPSE